MRENPYRRALPKSDGQKRPPGFAMKNRDNSVTKWRIQEGEGDLIRREFAPCSSGFRILIQGVSDSAKGGVVPSVGCQERCLYDTRRTPAVVAGTFEAGQRV